VFWTATIEISAMRRSNMNPPRVEAPKREGRRKAG
jgi:hypothetical protein